MHFIDYALKNSLITDQQAARLYEKISNLDRLVPSAEFKKALGVVYKDSKVIVSQEKNLHDKILSLVLEKFSQPEFIVAEIYKSGDKVAFMTKVLNEVRDANDTKIDQPKQDESQDQEVPSASTTPVDSEKKTAEERPTRDIDKFYPDSKVKKLPNPSERDKLFIGSIGIPTSHAKCSKLYRQLDSLSLKEHGLVAACAARAFLDISCQAYLETFDIDNEEGKKNRFGQSTLPDMIKVIANNLFKEKRIPKELKNILCNGDAANPQSFLHPQAFHAYIHGRYENSMNNLKEAWDRCYENLLRSLWLHVKEDQD